MNNTRCEANDPNSDFDVCIDGVCVGIDLCEGVICPQAEECFNDGICVTGVCQYEALPIGAVCDDGNPATDFDACNADSECIGINLCIANNITCAPPPSECLLPTTCFRGECLPYPHQPNGTACPDVDENDCTTAKCSDGICNQNNPIPDGAPCDDGSDDTK